MVEFVAMKTPTQPLSRDDWAKLILGLTLFFGLAVRIFPGLLARFPLNDGGMFLVMIRDLRANNFLLPAHTTYNFSNIPFAYPPLGFYAAGLLSVLGIPDIQVLHWLPALINFASIPVFYLLAKSILDDAPRAALASAVYALTPDSFAWQIMGGGITRSFGVLFILLALWAVYKMFKSKEWKFVPLSALFASLAFLSHPEVSLAVTAECGLFWLFFGRTRRGILQSVIVSAGVILLTVPWWGSVIALNGLAPFQSVLHSGAYGGFPLWDFLYDLFHFNVWRAIFNLLAIIGLIWNLWNRKFLLPVWMLLPYFIEPRSAPAFAYFPACMLAAQALIEFLPKVQDWIQRRRGQDVPAVDFVERKGLSLFLFGLMLLWFVQSMFYGLVLVNTSLVPPLPQQALAWVRGNTSAEARFLVLTGNQGVMTDPIQEWFPALAERRSQTTLQGLEWTLGRDFFPRLNQLAALQLCETVACVEEWSNETQLDYTDILVEKSDQTRAVLQSLKQDAHYVLLYDNPKYAVFEK